MVFLHRARKKVVERRRFGKGWMRLTNKKTARFREEAGGFSSSMIESVLT